MHQMFASAFLDGLVLIAMNAFQCLDVFMEPVMEDLSLANAMKVGKASFVMYQYVLKDAI